jgi:cleavage and polyadenylation specificity factor subunit 1
MPYAHRQEVISPSGVEFAVSLKLLHPLSNSSSLEHQVLGHLVVARSSLLRIFEVRQQFVTLREHVASSVDTTGIYGRRGTEAVEGEVAMDIQGDGFVSIAEVKVTQCISFTVE